MARAQLHPRDHHEPAAAPPDAVDFAADDRRPKFPMHRNVVVQISGGLDEALRVAMMLRGRQYRVRDLAVDVREGVVVSEVRATVVLTSPDTDLLLERLRRMPVVVSAEKT